jgi:hypothetical protein
VDKPSESSFDLEHPVYFYTVEFFDISLLDPSIQDSASFKWKAESCQWKPVCPDDIPGPEWTQVQRLEFLQSKYEGRKLAVEVCVVGKDAIQIYVDGVFYGDSWIDFFKVLARHQDMGHPGEWLLDRVGARNSMIAFLWCCEIRDIRANDDPCRPIETPEGRLLGAGGLLQIIFGFILVEDTW